MVGYIHSLQSLGTVDGPGVRAVVFASGCPLRCVYCHNPDTWHIKDGTHTEHTELAQRIARLYPYIKNGGVTFSGGEPCLQAEFFSCLARELKKSGLHIALDTSGCILNDSVRELLRLCDLVLLDVKFTSEEQYKAYTGGSLADTLRFLEECYKLKKTVWIRHVIAPDVNDTEEDIDRLYTLIRPYGKIIEQIELLPFKKLCLEKYESLGIPFPLRDTPEMPADKAAHLQKRIDNLLK